MSGVRIALVSDYYLPTLGGVQTVVKAHREALTEAGHDLYLSLRFSHGIRLLHNSFLPWLFGTITRAGSASSTRLNP